MAQLFRALMKIAPMTGPINVPRPPTATQTTASSDLSGAHFAGIDDADLRHVENAAQAPR